MSTQPETPDDEEPLDAATIDRLLTSMGTDMVLVGGQALSFWMERYDISAGDALVTNDGDALGKLEKAREMAIELKAELLKPPASTGTSLVGQIRIPARGGKFGNVDVLRMLYTTSGLRKSSDFTAAVIEDSIEFEWKPGRYIRVMNPLDLLDSRVQNAAGLLDQKGPHVLAQARWAIEVVNVVLTKLAADEASARDGLGQKIQAVFKLSKSQAGRKLLAEHDIDVLDAIDIHSIRRHTSVNNQQLDNIEKAIYKRQAGKKNRTAGRQPT